IFLLRMMMYHTNMKFNFTIPSTYWKKTGYRPQCLGRNVNFFVWQNQIPDSPR
ncbi:hypothetical protein ABEB36_010462, partial [Hypothenemus hampei]